MTTYRLMDGASGRPGVGSSGTQPPSAGTSYSGDYEAGLAFQVTSGGLWFGGYYWWVPATGGQTGAQKFALWQLTGGAAGTLVAGGTVTSGTLTAGQWNYVPLATPLLLTPGVAYCAATAFACTTGFPDTKNQFGSTDPYAAGITNGPLMAYSSLTGSAAVPGDWLAQSPYSTATADPATQLPATNDDDDLLWLDVQVGTTAPSGATYRAFPNMPYPVGETAQSGAYTLGMEFSLSQACTLEGIWHYSAPSSAVLPSRCGIWNAGTTAEVAGTDNSSPSWLLPGGGAASAGDGWVYCDYSAAGVTLQASVNYKVSTFYGGSGTDWFGVTTSFWSTGPGSAGITAGPLSVPDNAAASPGQNSWNAGITWTYPATSSSPENDWVDVEVTPAPSTPVSDSDTGAGADSGTVTASLSGTETGSGAEAGTVGLADTEAGSGADTSTLTASLPDADTAGGADAGTVTAGVPGSDTGSGGDEGTASVPVSALRASQLGGSAANVNTYSGSAT